jgi:hypothetical protein
MQKNIILQCFTFYYKEGFQINVFEKKMFYYLFTNIYSSVTTSQYLFMDGLVDCYEIILFILGAMSTTWFGDTFSSFRVSCPSVSYITFGRNEPSFDTNSLMFFLFSLSYFTFLMFRKLNKPQLTKIKQQNFIGIRAFDSRLYLDISRSFKWKESFIYRLIHGHFHIGLVIIPRPPYWPEMQWRAIWIEGW